MRWMKRSDAARAAAVAVTLAGGPVTPLSPRGPTGRLAVEAATAQRDGGLR